MIQDWLIDLCTARRLIENQTLKRKFENYK